MDRHGEIMLSFESLRKYCESIDFQGWDPYDGLTSRLFRATPFAQSWFFRLAWIQLFKRSPVNLRKLTGVKKDYNPKGIGLFLHSYCLLYESQPTEEHLQKIHELARILISLQSPGYAGACWGYNFDWQARAFFQPKGTPTVVATTFNACALLEAYRLTGEQRYFDVAVSAKDFVLQNLNRTYDDDGDFAFSYSPLDHTQVFNASLLGSRLLSTIYHYTRDESLLEPARQSASFCCKHQKADGSWSYGTLPFHQWIDNFHTGYNLECLQAYQHYTGDQQFDQALKRGTTYYLNTFFNDAEGRPAYYNNKLYPVDIHNTSQLIITLSVLGIFDQHRALIDKVLQWTISNMQDKKGYYYYQHKPGVSSKIPYIRWAQAWMFYGFSIYFKETKHEQSYT